MAKRIICAGNWKMHKGPEEAEVFFRELRRLADVEFHSDLVIFPSTVNLTVARGMLSDTQIGWGGQNCYFEAQGAFTGETSPQVLAQMGASHCLVGHSERRQIFGETDSQCAKKVAALQRFGVTPVLCLGESLSERQEGLTDKVIIAQLENGLHEVDWEKPLWLAYEPVWAIGTGQVASAEQAGAAHRVLRQTMINMVGEKCARSIPILYGGSVKPENSRAIGLEAEVDGFLVGGASLNPEIFLSIYLNARAIQ